MRAALILREERTSAGTVGIGEPGEDKGAFDLEI
jgi:hypothetical protein